MGTGEWGFCSRRDDTRNARKRRLHSLLPISCSLLIFLSACASSPPGPLAIPADIAGIVHAGETNSPEEYALLDRMGTSWLLTTFYWSRVEPADDQWYFDAYDKYVDTAQAAGKKIIGVLAYDVGWLHENGKSRRYVPPDKLHFFLDYVQQMATHFQGRVDAWCIWNEPNFTFWTGSRDEYLLLARMAADALREIDPDVTLLGGAFNRGFLGLPKAYIRGLFESGAMDRADAVAFHPYELNPVRVTRLYNKFSALVGEYGFADRIWVTEVGYPTGVLYSEKKFPALVVKTFVNLTVSGVQKIFWYQMFDPVNDSGGFGLVRSENDHTSKGAEAFRLCALHLAGTTYRPDLPLRDSPSRRDRVPNSLRAFCFEKPEGGGTLVLWKEGGAAKIALHGLADGYTVHDPVSGNAEAVSAETVMKIGTVPIFVTWQGGGEEKISTLRISQAR